MSTSRNPDPKPFSLETDDRGDERSKGKQVKKDRLVCALAMGSCDKELSPMDSNYQEELVEESPRVKFNLNFDKRIRGIDTERPEREKFNIKKLFEAVSSGDASQLLGLEPYLHKTMKRLTNSEYQSKGKTALHKALLTLRNGRNDTVEALLDVAEKMGDLKEFVNAAYTDNNYRGHTALHVAIERRSIYYSKLLIQKGADVHARACGKFFQLHKTSEEPTFYFGELPLSLAACTNQMEIVDFLLDNPYQKVDVREADSQGNTVLHAMVMVADNMPENTEFVTRMYDHILSRSNLLHPKFRLEDIENKQGLTPIKLAAKMGKIGLFQHMMHREFQEKESRSLSRKFTEWVYGPVYSSLYDLAALDTCERNSVLEIVVYGSEIPNRLEMLQVEPLNKLLEEKWVRFARVVFFIHFLVYFLSIHLISCHVMSCHLIFIPPTHQHNYGLLSGHVITAVGALYFFIKGMLDMKRKSLKLQTFLVDGYSDFLFMMQGALIIMGLVLYYCNKDEYLGFMVLSLALSWINLLYYSRGLKHMGIYSVMIQKMIVGEIFRFLFVYVVFLFGFSAAVVTLLEEPEDKPKTRFFTQSNDSDCTKVTYKDIYFTTLELFKFTIGMGDLEFTEQYKYKWVFYLLLISYIVLTYILLLNMLIALMNKTVERLSYESTSIWKLQRAITILDVEQRLPFFLKVRLRSGVEKYLGGRNGEDCRWCLRVEEVNWKTWNTNVCINEEPGNQDFMVQSPPPPAHRPERGIGSPAAKKK
uniref:Ion transport domain-containing protein n=1 Tax=Denticeps clupeoides TaxID=299321 RepID=A0AAY4ER34_9TELE